VVIATPSALHAQQALAALDRGVAVFCQKPLARTAAENAAIIDAARKADRCSAAICPIATPKAMRRIRNAVVEGELGQSTRPTWCSTTPTGRTSRGRAIPRWPAAAAPSTSASTWSTWRCGRWASRKSRGVSSRLYAQGQPLAGRQHQVEDYAVAQIDLANGAVVRMACSWNLPFGRDAAIEAHFHGTKGGAAMTNVNGSFYDFAAARFHGTQRFPLAEPPDAWGGRAVVDWARAGAGRRATTADRERSCRWPACWTASMAGKRARRVLMTADTVGGVWTYAVNWRANSTRAACGGDRDHGRAAVAAPARGTRGLPPT
jgi:predicted dehydrogenase